jgi:hypothetical protein
MFRKTSDSPKAEAYISLTGSVPKTIWPFNPTNTSHSFLEERKHPDSVIRMYRVSALICHPNLELEKKESSKMESRVALASQMTCQTFCIHISLHACYLKYLDKKYANQFGILFSQKRVKKIKNCIIIVIKNLYVNKKLIHFYYFYKNKRPPAH